MNHVKFIFNRINNYDLLSILLNIKLLLLLIRFRIKMRELL